MNSGLPSKPLHVHAAIFFGFSEDFFDVFGRICNEVTLFLEKFSEIVDVTLMDKRPKNP